MKITEIITEGSGIRFTNSGPYFDRYEDYLRALNSDTGFIRKAAQDVMARGGQEGWPKQDQQVAQITMPTDSQKQKTILDPNRAGLSTADISKPQPMQEPMQIAKPEPVELDVAKPKSASRRPMSPAIRSRVSRP